MKIDVERFARDCARVLEGLGLHVEEMDDGYDLDFLAWCDDVCLGVRCVSGKKDLRGISAYGEWEDGISEIVRGAEALGAYALVVLPKDLDDEMLALSTFCESYGVPMSVTSWSALTFEVSEDPLDVDGTTEVFMERELGHVPEWPELSDVEPLLDGEKKVTPDVIREVVRERVTVDWKDLVMVLRWAGYSSEGFEESVEKVLESEEVEEYEGELMHVPDKLPEVLGALLVWLEGRGDVPEDEVYEFMYSHFKVPYDVTYLALKKLEERGEIRLVRNRVSRLGTG